MFAQKKILAMCSGSWPKILMILAAVTSAGALMDYPVNFVLVLMREIRLQRTGDGAAEEADSEADCKFTAADQSRIGERKREHHESFQKKLY